MYKLHLIINAIIILSMTACGEEQSENNSDAIKQDSTTAIDSLSSDTLTVDENEWPTVDTAKYDVFLFLILQQIISPHFSRLPLFF